MRPILLCILLSLAACRKDEPPAPSSEESAQLNEAEEMLNAASAKEEGPEAKAPDPPSRSD